MARGQVIQIINSEAGNGSRVLHTWGENGYGQLGDSRSNNLDRPQKIDFAVDCSYLSGKGYSLHVIRQNGKLFATGYNTYGGLGIGNTEDKNQLVEIGEKKTWLKVASGYYHSLALTTGGELYGTGYNAEGQLGDNTWVQKNSFTRIGDDKDRWMQIDVGLRSSVAIKRDRSLWAWGLNDYGQLGVGLSDNKINKPTRIGINNDWKIVSMGQWNLAMINLQNELYACGASNYGQLGNGSFTAINPEPVRIGGDSKWIAVAVGAQYHTLAIKWDRTLWAWGLDESGKLGLGSDMGNKTRPTQVGRDHDWAKVAAGPDSSMALKMDGSHWIWGRTPLGNFNVPTRVDTENDWNAISCGWRHFSGLRNNEG